VGKYFGVFDEWQQWWVIVGYFLFGVWYFGMEVDR